MVNSMIGSKVDSMLNPQNLGDSAEDNKVIWEVIYQKSDWGRYPCEDLIRFIAKNYYTVPDRSKIKILDLGCGTGTNLWYLAREGFTIFGIEGSKTAVEKCKSRLKNESLNGRVIQGDFTDLSGYEDNFFDAIIDISSVQQNSLDKIKMVISEIHCKLKPGGKFFGKMVADSLQLKKGNYGYTHFFTEEEIKSLFNTFLSLKIGFVELKQDDVYNKSWLVEAQK